MRQKNQRKWFNLQHVACFYAINLLLLHITDCYLLDFMSQGLQVTPSTLCSTMVNHFPLKIKTMTHGPRTVPVFITEPGGTSSVTILTWMAFIVTTVQLLSQMVSYGTTGRHIPTHWRGPWWKLDHWISDTSEFFFPSRQMEVSSHCTAWSRNHKIPRI